MNKVFAHQQFFKGNMLTVLGVMLCLYFSYHAVFGHRSVLALSSLNAQIVMAVSERDNVSEKRHDLEVDVLAMRPDSMNPDMVEERARAVLGYKRVGEVLVLGN